MAEFVDYYNHDHRHAGIGLHTPADVHYGLAATTARQRSQTLAAARRGTPNGSPPPTTPRSSTCPTRPGSTNPKPRKPPPRNHSRWPQPP